MTENTCYKCNQTKPLDTFVKGKGGVATNQCKLCYNQYVKDKGYNRYCNRAEYHAEWQRKLRQTAGHKKYDSNYRKLYPATFAGAVTKLLCASKRRSKSDNREFDLDRSWIEEHLTPMKCEATGIDLVLNKDDTVYHTPFRPSVDRIDNNKGYTKDNCRIVSVIFNKAKSDYSDADVLRMAEGLVNSVKG